MERTSLGLDVHARSVVAAAIDGVTGEVVRARLSPYHDDVLRWGQGLPGPVAATCEAGPTGFGLYRALQAAGVRCEVAAPSKPQRPSDDRVKADQRDALHLARLLRLGEVTSVTVPSLDRQAARDLVWAHEDRHGDLMRARHRVSKLPLRHGIVYSGGQAWTGRHDAWLRGLHLPTAAARVAFDSDYDAVPTVLARRDRLDAAILAMAAESEFTPVVHRLGCLRADLHPDRVRPGGGDRDRSRFSGNTIGSFIAWCRASTPRAPPASRARSPRPATATPAG